MVNGQIDLPLTYILALNFATTDREDGRPAPATPLSRYTEFDEKMTDGMTWRGSVSGKCHLVIPSASDVLHHLGASGRKRVLITLIKYVDL